MISPSRLHGLMPKIPPADEFISLDALAKLDDVQATLAIRKALGSILRQVLRSKDGALREGKDPGDLRLSSLGVDSLMAMEMRNRVRTWANVDVPAHVLIGNGTVAEVAELVYQRILLGYLRAPSGATEITGEEVLIL
jgi:hypothetical protein